MPAQLDLTGRTFGQLTVISRNGTVKWGRTQAGWLCRCECGQVLTVPQNRLPHRASIPDCHVLDKCEDCRAKPCEVCGAPIPARVVQKTCSPECCRERKRQIWRANYYQLAANPLWRMNRAAAVRQRRMELSPEERRAIERKRYQCKLKRDGRKSIQQKQRIAYAARMGDPTYVNRQRQRYAAWRKRNIDRARAYSRNHRRREREQTALREMVRTTQGMTERSHDE